MARQHSVLAIVLAGGEGKRLHPLTEDRCKPAVPFGGRYRIVDFVLSNLVNSGIFRIIVLTQFKSQSLIRHIQRGWQMSGRAGHFIEIVPAQMRRGPHWYRGSGDAIYQNLDILGAEPGEIICVFGADHIYKMDVMQMVTAHIQSGAECTVSAMPVPIEEASQYGIMAVDDSGRIVEFQEKPERPAPMPGDASRALASMGNYVFTRAALVRAVTEDARSRTSSNDLGKNIVPMFVKAGAARAYSFADNRILGADPTAMPYWRDVGTLDSYYEACTDLVSVSPKFDLYNPLWPIMSHYEPAGPAKFVFADRKRDRIGMATDSMVCEGCIISGGQVDHSVLGPRVRINSFAEVESSILFEGVNVGRRARIRNAIVDKDVDIPPDTIIGFDAEADRERFAMTESGIVIIPKSAKLARRVRSVEPSLRADPLAPRLG